MTKRRRKCCTQATRGRADHRAGGEETDSTGQFHVPGTYEGPCAETGRTRERYVEEYRPERTRGGSDGGPVDFKKTKVQGREHVFHTGMPVGNGNPGTD